MVLAPRAGAAVAGFRERFDSSWPTGMPAHVTVLYPFVDARTVTPAMLARVDALAANMAAFDYRLDAVDEFPAALYLVPTPSAPFVTLTEAAAARWPDHPPYEGRFDTVIPHLTVSDTAAGARAASEVAALLPLEERAEELVLIAPSRDGRWTTRHRSPLGLA